MMLLKQILLIVLFSIFCKCDDTRKSNNSVNKLTRSSKGSEGVTEHPLEPIIKDTTKPKDKSNPKHVTFADQVLDDSIGADPLETKASNDRKCPKGKLQKSSTGAKKNNALKNHSISLIWLFFSSFLLIILVSF